MAIRLAHKYILIALFIPAFSSPILWGSAQAEVEKSISVGSTYDNNAYGSYEGEADYITSVDIGLANRLTGDRHELETYYAGNGNIFAQVGARTFLTNDFGILYARRIGEGRDGIYAGGSASFRLGRAPYDAYDYAGFQGTVTGKWYADPTVMLRSGYRLRYRNFWNLKAYSYTEHYLFAQINKFLPSRTTLRGEISYGYKNHRDPEEETFDFGRFQRGRNFMPTVTAEPGVPDQGQVALRMQVAQSLAENTGLSVRYEARLNTSDNGYDPYWEALGYSEDSDVFNDRYDYTGHEWTARLTQQLPWTLRAVLETGYESRHYDGRTAFDLSGEPIASGDFRKDRNTFAGISLEAPLTPSVDAELWYGYERNRSNDLYYDYGGRHSFSVRFKIGF